MFQLQVVQFIEVLDPIYPLIQAISTIQVSAKPMEPDASGSDFRTWWSHAELQHLEVVEGWIDRRKLSQKWHFGCWFLNLILNSCRWSCRAWNLENWKKNIYPNAAAWNRCFDVLLHDAKKNTKALRRRVSTLACWLSNMLFFGANLLWTHLW